VPSSRAPANFWQEKVEECDYCFEGSEMESFCKWRTPKTHTGAVWFDGRTADGFAEPTRGIHRRVATELLQLERETSCVVETYDAETRQAIVRIPTGPDIKEIWLYVGYDTPDYPFQGPISLRVLNHLFLHHPTVELGSGRLTACGCQHLSPQGGASWSPSLTLKALIFGPLTRPALYDKLRTSYKEAVAHGKVPPTERDASATPPADQPVNVGQLPPKQYLARWCRQEELPPSARQQQTPRPPVDVIMAGPLAVAQFFRERAQYRWSPKVHRLFPPAARARAVDLLLIGRRLPLPLEVWVQHVMPYGVPAPLF
jgi:hypothetical protein